MEHSNGYDEMEMLNDHMVINDCLDHMISLGENYSYGPLKIHSYFLGLQNFQLPYLAFNPTFDSLSGLSVNLTL
jgi:hypothetical protein